MCTLSRKTLDRSDLQILLYTDLQRRLTAENDIESFGS